MNKIEEEVWAFVQEMNRKWTIENNADDLKNYFHKDMVAITPSDQNRIEGGERCVAGWKRFSENTKIHSWKESEPKVRVYGNGTFAIVTYYFDISFDMMGKNIVMRGRDMFSLINDDGKWMIVADQYSPFPSF